MASAKTLAGLRCRYCFPDPAAIGYLLDGASDHSGEETADIVRPWAAQFLDVYQVGGANNDRRRGRPVDAQVTQR